MKAWTVALALALGVPAGEALADRSPQSLVRERCQVCHGPTGKSTNPDFPKLAGQNADYITRQLANFKTGVRRSATMREQVADLTGGEMRALALFFSAQELIPDVAYDPVLVELGRQLYFSGNTDTGVTACVTCHGPRARGAMFLPRLAGQHARYIENQIHAFLDQSRSSPDMVMHKVVENISETEIEAAAQFLSVFD